MCCLVWHHKSLRRSKVVSNRYTPTTSVTFAPVLRPSKIPIRLCIVALGMVASTGLLKALAFVHGAADSTLTIGEVLQKQNFLGILTPLSMNSVDATQVAAASQVFATRFAEQQQTVLALSHPQCRSQGRFDVISSSWPRLREASVVNREGEGAGLPIGRDLRQSSWIIK